MSEPSNRVPEPTPAERKLIEHINKTWSRHEALQQLKEHLQIAIEVELATIPVYLFTYYSIDRTPADFPDSELSRFADKAGALIMSVAVEEMLHMSLSSNILFALGQEPQLYGRSPGPYPSNLPGHAKLGPDGKKFEIPLAKFSEQHLGTFLEIEYPESADAPPEGQNWKTIGQIYSYISCIIRSNHIKDEDFQKGPKHDQIQPTNYSPNNIDTVYAKKPFNSGCPVAAPQPHSAASVAAYSSNEDSHVGPSQLLTIASRQDALEGITTIGNQGEGYSGSRYDDLSHQELSHYYKFLTLQSELTGYNPQSKEIARRPTPPPPADRQVSPEELTNIVFDFPENPVAASYPPGRKEVADVASGLYQYMLIMTESIYRYPGDDLERKKYFNRSMHMSMIWILDKFIRAMRGITLSEGSEHPSALCLAPTFENINLGTRAEAFGNLKQLCSNLNAAYGHEKWYADNLQGYVNMIPNLPDVSDLWEQPAPGCDISRYVRADVPQFPSHPPQELAPGEARHSCMGLNSCKNQGRTRDNACAGQGYCSTALAYNPADPSSPWISDHTCHVLNNCKSQGGCGLYGTAEELAEPGHNACQSLGSCATPINAERFITDGPYRGQSVWLRARTVFEEKVWPQLVQENSCLPPTPPPVHGDVFAYGPTIEWIQEYSGAGMTACGSSGMSGAGSCA